MISPLHSPDLVKWRAATPVGLAYMRLRRLIHLMPRVRGRSRLLTLVSQRFLKGSIRLVNGRNVCVALNPMDYIGDWICLNGSFEPRSLDLCARLLADGGVFFDVGANFGLYSLTLASLPDVSCVAVEPLPQAAVKLMEHREMNPGSKLQIFSVALSSRSGILNLEPPANGNFGTGKVVSGGTEGVLVSAATVGQVLEAAGHTQVRVMKMDVEGHEMEVLRGMDFSEAPDHLILEQEDAVSSEIKFRAIWDLLLGQGYMPFDVLGSSLAFGAIPIEKNVWWTRQREEVRF